MSFFSPKVLTSLSLTNLSSNVKVNVTLVRMKTSFVWLFFFNTSPWWEIIRFTKEDGWNGPTQWNVVIYIGVEVSFLISIRELGKQKKKNNMMLHLHNWQHFIGWDDHFSEPNNFSLLAIHHHTEVGHQKKRKNHCYSSYFATE